MRIICEDISKSNKFSTTNRIFSATLSALEKNYALKCVDVVLRNIWRNLNSDPASARHLADNYFPTNEILRALFNARRCTVKVVRGLEEYSQPTEGHCHLCRWACAPNDPKDDEWLRQMSVCVDERLALACEEGLGEATCLMSAIATHELMHVVHFLLFPPAVCGIWKSEEWGWDIEMLIFGGTLGIFWSEQGNFSTVHHLYMDRRIRLVTKRHEIRTDEAKLFVEELLETCRFPRSILFSEEEMPFRIPRLFSARGFYPDESLEESSEVRLEIKGLFASRVGADRVFD
uniref:SprT-like domain-containing protein n=1 Tax=Mycena chlorophos TaxID=658473 RepID=A0ABQ0LUF8_MYCCL|nr:predicted protein [Mycena chlorophos]